MSENMNTMAPEDRLLLDASRLMSSGDFDNAIAALDSIRRVNPRHEVATGMLGAIHAQLNAPERAAECFEEVLALNPSNFLARFHLGMLKFDAQQPRAALDIWQSCLSEPTDFVVHYHCGLAWMRLDQIDEARRMFQRAAQRTPPEHELHAQVHEMLKRLGEAA
jgi:tetratricopeptide (TPR) repeat protein